MGDASRVTLAIAEETTFGTNPGSGFAYWRFNSEGLKPRYTNVQSRQIDPTRQPSANIRTARAAQGNIIAEDSLRDAASTPTGHDLLIEGACMSDFSTIAANAGILTTLGTPSAGIFSIAGTGILTNLVVGDWFKLTGFAQGTLYLNVVTRADANTGTAQGVTAAGVPAIAQVATASSTGTTVKIGTTKKSYTIEKAFNDLTVPEYSLYTGMRVNSWSERFEPGVIFEHTFDFLGKLQATTTASGAGSPGAVWATPILEAVDHFKMKMVGAFITTSTTRIQSINFTLNNNLRVEEELGTEPQDIGISTPTLDGTIQLYMADATVLRLAEAGTRTKFAFRLDDGTRSRIYGFNQVLLGEPEVLARGNDQSVVANFPFSCEADTTTGIAFTVTRV